MKGSRYLAEGVYGYRDADWRPVVAEVEDLPEGLSILLPSPINIMQSLRVEGTDRLYGTFHDPASPRPVLGTKLGPAERVSQTPHYMVLALQKPLREAVWTAAMSSMPIGRSSSTVPAPLPEVLQIHPPLPGVPAKWARFSGRWSGWACFFAWALACDTRLAVLTIYGDRADVIFTWGDRGRSPMS